MGRIRAEEMIQHAGFEAALRDHLQHNHYPPVSEIFLPYAKRAIRVAQRAAIAYEVADRYEGDRLMGRKITLPNKKKLTVREIVDGLHLEPFVEAVHETKQPSYECKDCQRRFYLHDEKCLHCGGTLVELKAA